MSAIQSDILLDKPLSTEIRSNMSEIRQDPTTKEWVIVARERSKRPHDFIHQQSKPELPAYSPTCPFCPGIGTSIYINTALPEETAQFMREFKAE